MAKRIVSDTHVWVGAVTIPLDGRSAASAHRRGTYKVNLDTAVDILDVYCSQCKRSFADIGGQIQCPAAESNDHLIGGPTGTRKLRKHDHDCDLHGCEPDLEALRSAVGFGGI
jgi:hypothetical protein